MSAKKPAAPRKPRQAPKRAPVIIDNATGNVELGNGVAVRQPSRAVAKSGPDRSRQAKVEGIFGATGAGKTTYVMRELDRDKPARLMVWDTKGEFAREGYGVAVTSMAQVIAMLRNPTFAICYQPRGDEARMRELFNLFCRAAYAAKNLTLVAEELSDVTTPSYAPQGWRECTAKGRSEGLTVYGLSQQPASVDKHFFGNCTLVRTGRLNFEAHVKTMAKVLRVPATEVDSLKPLEYVERDLIVVETRRGKLTF